MPLSLAFSILVAAGLTAGVHADTALAPFVSALLAACAGAAVFARHHGLRFTPEALGACAVVCAASLHGMHALQRAEHSSLRHWFDQRVALAAGPVPARQDDLILVRGRLTRDASLTNAGATIHLAVDEVSLGGAWEEVDGGATVNVGGTLNGDTVSSWRAGRRVSLPAVLRVPARYLNEGVADGERASALRGTALVGSVKSGVLVEVLERGRWWDETAAEIRAAVRRAMARRVAPLDPQAAAIGTAILIGDRAQMTHDLQRRLQEAGTYHVVAISGGNIALLAAAVLAALWLLGVRFATGALVALVVLVVHAWVIGGGPSVTRATVMAVVYLALRTIDQRTAPVNAIGVGAALMLVASPLDVVNAGFWLTFGATGALLGAGAVWPRSSAVTWRSGAVAICVSSLAVELVLMPVSALVFERVTLAGLLLNLAAVPAMAVVQGAASVCVLTDAWGPAVLADGSSWVTYGAARALVDSSSLVDFAPWATWRVLAPAWWLIAAYYTALVVWWTFVSRTIRDRVHVRAAGAVMAVLWLWIALAPQAHARTGWNSRLRVTAMDVGQGDAVLVTFPQGQTMLMDAGGVATRGDFDIGDRVLGPALRARGLLRLDYFAVSHGDADHIGGAQSVLRDFRPREVWSGVPVNAHEPERVLQAESSAQRSGWRWLQGGDRVMFGDVELRVHHPPLPDWERQRVRNDDSLVVEVRYGQVSVLLTGDISRHVEAGLLEQIHLLPIVVLKAPHHGSATSSSLGFLQRTRPRAVLLSAGRGNLYGHPSPDVLARYEAMDTAVFRTDRDGQIELVTDGESLEVTTYTGLKWRAR